jgi:ketosteroid isomerase-like protein
MSGERVRRLYPGVSTAFLEANFKDVKDMRLEFSDMNISFDGATAIVTVQERQRFTPGNGSRGQWNRSATYRLQKRAVNWMIVDRQSGEVR